MNELSLLILLVNNALWMGFFYIFTPKENRRDVSQFVPPQLKPKKNTEIKLPPEMEELTDTDMKDVAKSVGMDIKN